MGAHGVLESIEAPELHREAFLGLDREKVGSQIIPELRVFGVSNSADKFMGQSGGSVSFAKHGCGKVAV
jgi:hypothetical protein